MIIGILEQVDYQALICSIKGSVSLSVHAEPSRGTAPAKGTINYQYIHEAMAMHGRAVSSFEVQFKQRQLSTQLSLGGRGRGGETEYWVAGGASCTVALCSVQSNTRRPRTDCLISMKSDIVNQGELIWISIFWGFFP